MRYSLLLTILFLPTLFPTTLPARARKQNDTAIIVSTSLPSTKGKLSLKSGKTVDLHVAVTDKDHRSGISGIAASDFSDEEGLLFLYKKTERRLFWMPDTHFNLDIFFLDEKFEVVALERNIPHHPGWDTPPEIYKTLPYRCRAALEMKGSSALAKEIEVGDVLKINIGSEKYQKPIR